MSTLLASRPFKTNKTTRAFFQQIVFAALFVGSRAALCLVRWRAGHLRFPQLIAGVRSIIVETKELPYWKLQQMRTL